MNRTLHFSLAALSAVTASTSVVAQTSRPAGASSAPSASAEQEPPPKTLAELVGYLAKRGVGLDLKTKSVKIDCVVGRPTEPVEYLLIHPRGKSHESILVAEVMPSVLNTALLALGYSEGKNARVVEKDPLPTLEQVRAGAPWLDVFPPEGQDIWMTASWTHDGETHSDVPVADLLQDESMQKPVQEHRWIFLGGNTAPLLRGDAPVFVGDYQGNIVSSCYMHPPNHLITIAHERGNDEQNWWVTPLVPPTGTPMKLTFWANKPPVVVAREKKIAAEARAAAKQAGSQPATDSRPSADPRPKTDSKPTKKLERE